MMMMQRLAEIQITVEAEAEMEKDKRDESKCGPS